MASVSILTAGGKMGGSEIVEYCGYKDCIKLENKSVKLVLSGACGGRVLEYSLNGKNAIYLDREQDGWTYVPGKDKINPGGGRLDIGPERIVPKHLDLWIGKWTAEITGQFSASLTSAQDKETGVQLIRNFNLAPDSSILTVTQTIRNISDKTVSYCHWSRTLAPPDGICIVPLTPDSHYPEKYIMYKGNTIDFRPKDENILVKDDSIIIKACPEYSKLGFDSSSGWLAYMVPNDILFIKKFPVYPDRVYNEITGMTVCIYYHKKFCELEPIGPKEIIKPGQSASFTEIWQLENFPFPGNANTIDIVKVKTLLK